MLGLKGKYGNKLQQTNKQI